MGNEINKFTLTCFGVNIAIATAAILFAPVTGTLVDRMSRRKLMIIADVMRCIVMILIAVIAFFNKMLYIPLLILLIIRSIGSALFTPASNAALVTYVEEKHVQQAISIKASINTNYICGNSFIGKLFN